jgi:hypothetical protein
MIQYSWEIISMKTENDNDLNNIVNSINYKRTGIEEELKYSIQGEYFCEYPDKEKFTEYQNLTFEQVCSWIENKIRIEVLDNKIQEEIEKQKNTILQNNKLPWVIEEENPIIVEEKVVIEEKEVILEPKTI